MNSLHKQATKQPLICKKIDHEISFLETSLKISYINSHLKINENHQKTVLFLHLQKIFLNKLPWGISGEFYSQHLYDQRSSSHMTIFTGYF